MPSKTSFVCLFAMMIAACGLDTGGDNARATLPPAASIPSPPRTVDSGTLQGKVPAPSIGAAAQDILDDASAPDATTADPQPQAEAGAHDASPPPPPQGNGKNGKGDDG